MGDVHQKDMLSEAQGTFVTSSQDLKKGWEFGPKMRHFIMRWVVLSSGRLGHRRLVLTRQIHFCQETETFAMFVGCDFAGAYEAPELPSSLDIRVHSV